MGILTHQVGCANINSTFEVLDKGLVHSD